MRNADLFQFLKLIHAEGKISRAGLAEKTRLAPSYITVTIRELQEKGWLLEGERLRSHAGRRRRQLHINPELAHLLGIEIGRAYSRIVVTDFLGTALYNKRIPSQVQKGRDHVLSLIHTEVKSCLRQDQRIQGIGIAHSGVIDSATGSVLFWPEVQGWRDVPLKQIFESDYGLPAVIEDSVRTWALAEQRFGQGKGHSNFVCIDMGMGIGAAIFIDGRPYVGASGLAGELGHTTIDENGDLCSCGNRGCLEVFASGAAIINRVRSALEKGVSSVLGEDKTNTPENLSMEAIVAAARGHDRLCELVLREAGTHLGTALAGLVNLLNPEAIILGGAVPRAATNLMLESLLGTLKARAFQQSVSRVEVTISQLADDAAAVGAALANAGRILEGLCQD